MSTATPRPYGKPSDLQAIVRLLCSRPAERMAEFPTITDMQEILGTEHGRANTYLWSLPGGPAVAFAVIDPQHGNLIYEVSPDVAGSALESEIIDLGEQQIGQAGRATGQSTPISVGCRDNRPVRMAVLEKHGYVAQPVRTLHLGRSLQEPIPAPQPPPGFSLRHVLSEHEAEALTALHRAAFGTPNLTVEDRLAWMRVPGYDPELDLVAVAPDGALAAYCHGWINREQNAVSRRNVGYLDPVGTYPDYRRRGLARALLLTGMQRLLARGMESAALSTWGENIAMQRAARATGFQVVGTTIFYEKEIDIYYSCCDG